jgi:hypothetical protein
VGSSRRDGGVRRGSSRAGAAGGRPERALAPRSAG